MYVLYVSYVVFSVQQLYITSIRNAYITLQASKTFKIKLEESGVVVSDFLDEYFLSKIENLTIILYRTEI